jgi:hypothetical protein
MAPPCACLLPAELGRLRRLRGMDWLCLDMIYSIPLLDLILVASLVRPQPGTLAVAGRFGLRRLTPVPPLVAVAVR